MNGPDSYPGVADAIAERNELQRIACQRVIEKHDRGEPVDEVTLQFSREFVANVAPLGRALSPGVPL